MAAPKGNKFAEGNDGGRPPYFDCPEDMQLKIDEYIELGGKLTISGLAYHLGFETRKSFYDYEEKEEFVYIIKRARLYMEMYYEELTQGNNVAGPIFVLKNMGWEDKQGHEFSEGGIIVNLKHG